MNPASLFKIKQAMGCFQGTHPKFISFLRDVFGAGIPEGSVIEISVTKPGMDKVTTNIKVQQSDLELLDGLRDLT